MVSFVGFRKGLRGILQELRVSGLRFRVWALRFRVQGYR